MKNWIFANLRPRESVFFGNCAKFLTLEISLVGQEALTRYQRLKYQRLQCDIFSIWEKYNNDEITAKDLIKTVTYFNGPASTE
jgi:hypothetical protein